MGFFKKIGNAITDGVNDAIGTNFSVGSSGGSGGDITFQQASAIVMYSLARALRDEKGISLAQATDELRPYKETPEFERRVRDYMNKVNSKSGLSGAVTDGLNAALDSAENSLSKELDKVLNKSSGSKFTDVLGNFGSKILDSAVAKWLKKNWFYVVIPFGLIVYFLVNGKGTGKKKKNKWF